MPRSGILAESKHPYVLLRTSGLVREFFPFVASSPFPRDPGGCLAGAPFLRVLCARVGFHNHVPQRISATPAPPRPTRRRRTLRIQATRRDGAGKKAGAPSLRVLGARVGFHGRMQRGIFPGSTRRDGRIRPSSRAKPGPAVAPGKKSGCPFLRVLCGGWPGLSRPSSLMRVPHPFRALCEKGG